MRVEPVFDREEQNEIRQKGEIDPWCHQVLQNDRQNENPDDR